jgi:hypothetical protein
VSANKAKGTKWESAIVAFLRDRGFTYAERRALSGSSDKGDLTGIPGLVVEAKHVARTDLSGWLDEAEQERDNANADVGLVWIKRRAYTSPGRAYVVMSGDDLVWLLKAAGYGPPPATDAAA